MAPRHETAPAQSTPRRFLPCIPESWPLISLCAAACALVGLILFIAGIIGVVQPSSSQVRDWIFLTFGVLLLAFGLSMFLVCRMRSIRHAARRPHRGGRRRTRPSRREPLPVWTVDAIDPSFRPPPTYYEALHCTPHTPGDPVASPVSAPVPLARPPPYTPTAPAPQQRITDV